MGNLAAHLQQAFQIHSPPEWQVVTETPLLTTELHRLLGYAPRVDVLLTRTDGERRLWIEFEISRADPVANHAKFATGHLFSPQSPQDAFLSMVSPHVRHGRRNLAANTIWVMRYLGMQAYQTPLLPHLSPGEIKRLNHLDRSVLEKEPVAVQGEIERVLAISQTLAQIENDDIHFVANNMEVFLNLRQWNQDLATPAGQAHWGKRTVTYFVYDPRTRQFAPSKFCAYVAIRNVSSTMRHFSE
jgi:Asp-tRNA(Asn)/Glu-tRNA(Gln) amidotransferase C subunit